MKKILLAAVNAKYIHSNLAVHSLLAYGRKYETCMELAEFTINQNKDEILKGIFCRKPDILCISCYIWNISFVEEIIREIHKILPETIIWLGGPEVSYDAKKVLEEHLEVFGVMKGEGEETFLELAEYYEEEKGSLEEIRGITYRKNTDGIEEIRENPWREVMDLSKIPFVYDNLDEYEHRIIYYESSRGCPFSCSYCLSSIDKKLRFRNLDLVKKELQFFLDHKVPQVKFVDRTFNCNHEHAMEIWKYLTEHDNGITNFHFEIAADLIREDELELIAGMRPGMIQLEIGVQSTNLETIREIHRKMDFSKVARIVRSIQKHHNVHQHLDLIAGLPMEDYESFGRSFDEVYALRPQQLQLGFLKVLKGSFMHDHVKDYGCSYQDKEPYEVLYTKWLTYGDVLKLKLIEDMVEVYYNSGQFMKTLPAVEKLFGSPFAFYEALGLFYEKNGYMSISHTRIRRYEILQEFLEQYDQENMELYRQLMVFDLYSRENMKTRPSWAKDLKPYKNAFREYYQKDGKMIHLEVMDFDPDTYEPGRHVMMFDYRERDILTYGAKCTEVAE